MDEVRLLNITFLIGNGFDRNLGLDTTYSDFVKHYKRIEPKTDNLKNFHKYIKENEELWSAAEIAMGEYTGELEKGQAEVFAECQTDFCEKMAEYFTSLGMPQKLREFDIPKECAARLSELCTFGKTREVATYISLDYDKIKEIFELCW